MPCSSLHPQADGSQQHASHGAILLYSEEGKGVIEILANHELTDLVDENNIVVKRDIKLAIQGVRQNVKS